MVIGTELNQVKQWSKQALERLGQDGLLPTPQNYTVYYYYCSGGMAALNAAYNKLLGNGTKITQQKCDEFYNKYILSEGEQALLNANEVIDKELKKVMELMSASAQGAGKFGENLNEFTDQISGMTSIDALRGAVSKITEETHFIAVQNHKLQDQLAATTGQLSEMHSKLESAHKESQIDALTEVGNRKFFDREITETLLDAKENNTALSLLMVDIDHFKKFNDTHGHLIGDQVLRLVARTLIENLKGRDIIARYGGEEFAIILPLTRVQDAERVANLLRASLATKQLKKRDSNEVLGVITVSIGAAEHKPGEDKDSWIGRADASLYKAKQTGRNKVVCDTPVEIPKS